MPFKHTTHALHRRCDLGRNERRVELLHVPFRYLAQRQLCRHIRQWISRRFRRQRRRARESRIHFNHAKLVRVRIQRVVNAFLANTFSSCALEANPLPNPHRANADRNSTGYPIFSAAAHASSTVVATSEGATFSCTSSSFCANNCRLGHLYSLDVRAQHTHLTVLQNTTLFQLSPSIESPPNCNKMPSGCSFSITCVTYSGVMGKKYTLCAILAEVCTVAIFGLMSTSTTCTFSSFNASVARTRQLVKSITQPSTFSIAFVAAKHICRASWPSSHNECQDSQRAIRQ